MSHKNPFWLPDSSLPLSKTLCAHRSRHNKPLLRLYPHFLTLECHCYHVTAFSLLNKWRTAKFHWVQGFGCRGWNQWLEAGWRQGMKLMLVPSLNSAVSLHELANKDCAIQRTVGCPHYRNCVSRYFQVLYYRGTFRVPTIPCILCSHLMDWKWSAILVLSLKTLLNCLGRNLSMHISDDPSCLLGDFHENLKGLLSDTIARNLWDTFLSFHLLSWFVMCC